MEQDKRLTAIRLPLQIGTSALWSLARTSAFFPGLVLVGVGIWTCIKLIDLDKIGIGLGAVAVITGGVLIYYAWRHARLALEERPSDVLLDAQGLRVEGGERDGLSFRWSELDPSRCNVTTEMEARFVLWRVLANVPLLAISVLGEADATMDFSEKVQVHRLFVATRGNDEPFLVAEADLEIEQRSLETLARAIQSSRWYGGQRPHAAAAPSAVICHGCGATVAPTSQAQVACRFCGRGVPIPVDVRTRVDAAAALASTRRSGMARLERLLESQPSAAFANVAMWVAAIPIALAWPVAGALILRNAYHSTLTPGRALAMAVLPLLLTFGAFLLARGRLTDRFALHAVVVGFGARDPVRPGEPYRCRACQANLPDATATPVVHCIYCNQANVLGLDLRGDAHEAEHEHAELESAFAARARERLLWGLGSAASMGLLVAAFFVVRTTMRDLPPPPHFADLRYTATVVNVTVKSGYNFPDDVTTWDVGITPAMTHGATCRVWVVPTGLSRTSISYKYNHTGDCSFAGGVPVHFSDKKPSGSDGDAMVELDVPTKTVTLRDASIDGKIERWNLTLRLDPLGTVAPTVHTAQPTATPTVNTMGPSTLNFQPIVLNAIVTSETGSVPFSAATCELRISQSVTSKGYCHAELECDSKRIYGAHDTSYTRCEANAGVPTVLSDTQTTPHDGDPVLDVNLAAATALVGDTSSMGETYAVSFRLEKPSASKPR